MRHQGRITRRKDDKGFGSITSSSGTLAALFALAFIAVLAALAFKGRLSYAVPAVYAVISIVTFIAYGFDKIAAEKRKWRTPESTLHLLDLAGGWPGGLAAQRLLRHKSSKSSFQVVFWATVAINGGLLAWGMSAQGPALLKSVITGTVAITRDGTADQT